MLDLEISEIVSAIVGEVWMVIVFDCLYLKLHVLFLYLGLESDTAVFHWNVYTFEPH